MPSKHPYGVLADQIGNCATSIAILYSSKECLEVVNPVNPDNIVLWVKSIQRMEIVARLITMAINDLLVVTRGILERIE